MPDISQLSSDDALRPARNRKVPGVVQAIIASTPATVDELVMVTIPDLDRERRGWLWGPCPWQPRIVSDSEFGFPSDGDIALVAFTNDDEPWIVEWWPYEL